MACPHFHAVKPRSQTDHSATAMFPLGDVWEGLCRVSSEAWEPDETSLLTLCNLGYARGICARFPSADPGPDAVRFTIVEDDGVRLRLYYVLERDHHPLSHGPLEFAASGAPCATPDAGGTAGRLARCYVESYRRRKMEASGG